MHVRDLDTVPHDQVDDGHSARDIIVLMGVLHQGEIMGLYGGTHPRPSVDEAKDHRHHAQGDRSIRATLITVGFGSFGGVGVTLACSACRVKGVKIGRSAITQERLGRL